MGTCPTCGASSIFGVKTNLCAWCGRTTCERCVPQPYGTIIYKIQPEAPDRGAGYDNMGFCSADCFNRFWEKVQNYPTHEVGTDIYGFEAKAIWLYNQAIISAVYQSNPDVAKFMMPKTNYAVQIHTPHFPAFPWIGPDRKPVWMFTNFRNKAKNTLADNLERCGRSQDAARIYEELQNYEKARQLRERDRHIVIKRTDMQVNLNALLQQVKDGGIVAVFRCPHCGGKLKINDRTTMNSLRTCEHCGSEIEAMDLADFLKNVLD